MRSNTALTSDLPTPPRVRASSWNITAIWNNSTFKCTPSLESNFALYSSFESSSREYLQSYSRTCCMHILLVPKSVTAPHHPTLTQIHPTLQPHHFTAPAPPPHPTTHPTPCQSIAPPSRPPHPPLHPADPHLPPYTTLPTPLLHHTSVAITGLNKFSVVVHVDLLF